MLPLAIAPMIDWTYTHFRVFMKILAPHISLYTEMQTTGAIRHQPERALAYHERELPHLILQLGGSQPTELAQAAKLAEMKGFAEINLNLGCPSDKVLAGQFGACLMRDAAKVSDCIRAMKDAVSIPVTAKTRIGVDHQDSYSFFSTFIHQLIESGCDALIVHARKAWLNGLSPKENRTIPPINYDYVYQIKKEISVPVMINGNIQPSEVDNHMQIVDGVMFGRLLCDNPFQITSIHQYFYPDTPKLNRTQAFEQYIRYLEELNDKPQSMSFMIKPVLNLAHGLPGNRRWKSQLLSIRTLDFALMYQALRLLEALECSS